MWFGEPWPSAERRAPICADDAERVETPVGEPCLYCSEPIAKDDRGELMPFGDIVKGEMTYSLKPGHRECFFREVMGGPAHVLGTCICQGGTDEPDLGMTPRQAALWVWRNWTSE